VMRFTGYTYLLAPSKRGYCPLFGNNPPYE
jgi:hypothetical protein